MDGNIQHWVALAHDYANNHPSIFSVSTIEHKGNGYYTFTAEYKVNLPGRFDIIGQTERGVRKREPVEFLFTPAFPFKAPLIFLRDDFCRNFPHINPSKIKVNPCIFYGNLDELLQQPKWFDHILDQMVDWFEKAAGDNLIDYKQGWEPMRSDDISGKIWYDKDEICNMDADFASLSTISFDFSGTSYVFSTPFKPERTNDISKTAALIFRMPSGKESNIYLPNHIKNFDDLCCYAQSNHINQFKERVKKESKKLKKVIVILVIRRPTNLIGSTSSLETINFGLEIEWNKNKNSIKTKSKVYFLSHREVCNPDILRRFSGIGNEQKYKWIVQLGCGSLGSKICVHLARNGNSNFVLIDKSDFHPHNNARHSLIKHDISNLNKAFLLKDEIEKMGIKVVSLSKDVQVIDFSEFPNSIIIDSTANLSVRNYLSKRSISTPIVHTSLYNHGKLAILTAESPDRNPRIDDLKVSIFSECLKNERLRDSLLSAQAVRVSTGQGCGSFTTIAPDSRISLAAAGMSAKIQTYISYGVPEDGDILYGFVDGSDMGIEWNRINSGRISVIAPRDNEYEIRILPRVIKIMEKEANEQFPDETGGVLIGHISLINKCITVSDLIPAPEDSIRTPSYFELGIRNLLTKIKEIEKKSNTLLTYLGTWHSHPNGGVASNLDKSTKERIKELRNYMPTVCLIWTRNGLLRV
jgi:integrative and conjugative element protein (TIGR02256 family)